MGILNRFTEGKIYKIVDCNNTVIYVGSTCQSLYQRYKTHQYKHPDNSIELIKHYPCETFQDLREEENRYINQYENLLNKNKAFASQDEMKSWQKQYYLDNRVKKNEYQLNLYEKKKPQKQAYQRERYYKKREQLKEYQRDRYQKLKNNND